jgi:UTP--glucose-1-phosphate uridylyltransferase
MEGFKKVTKAVIPVAGLGTRMLPATKAVPKELLPIMDKPIIQHVLEEAISCGIKEIILITRSGKEAIENHFDSNFELESLLINFGKKKILKKFPQNIFKDISIISIRQKKPLGLGDAILTAKNVINEKEPFSIFLPDEFLLPNGKKIDFDRMIKNFNISGNGQILSEKIKSSRLSNYGILDLEKKTLSQRKSCPINGITEKPSLSRAPSNYRVVGRYILPYEIFDFIDRLKPKKGNEIQLTDALQGYLKLNKQKIEATLSDSQIYDCGSLKGFLGANLALASKDKKLMKYLRGIIKI